MEVAETPREMPAIGFTDGEGGTHGLDAYRGRGVVLNFWATWCAPCVREMPALDRLHAEAPGGVAVIALSSDREGAPVVESFYRANEISGLDVAIDANMAAGRQVGIRGLPTTLLIDAEGRERGRLAGAAEWDAPAVVEFIRTCIGQDEGESGS